MSGSVRIRRTQRSLAIWRKCADRSLPPEEYQKKLQEYLTGFVCAQKPSAKYVAERLILDLLIGRKLRVGLPRVSLALTESYALAHRILTTR